MKMAGSYLVKQRPTAHVGFMRIMVEFGVYGIYINYIHQHEVFW